MLERTTVGAVLVISCNEDITSENFETFRSEFRLALGRVVKGDKVVLNLEGVEHIASSALGLIASSYPEVVRVGAQLRVVAASEEVLRLLNVTRLSKVIRVDSKLESAVQAMK